MPTALVAWTSFIFFLSGVAALIFETLWFRQAGLAFGNSVWASALVVSSYMAGLAVGNGLAARYGRRLENPIVVYAGLELAIGVSGMALVLLLPSFTNVFASLLRPFFETTALLQPARFLIAFGVLLAPAIAMGATLPVLVRAVGGGERSFGQVLGLLYGINTLGAVVGAITSEFVWIPLVGIIGSGLVAAGFNVAAAALALAIAGRARAARPTEDERAESGTRPIGWKALPLLLASFGSGGILLALEVVWFRILTLLLPNLPEVFAWLLAVVLCGIALGGLLASIWLRFHPGAANYVSAVALFSGAVTVASYVATPAIADHFGAPNPIDSSLIFKLSIPLMFGVSLFSGVLFPLLGQRLRKELASDVRSAGLLTLANTAGATLGPLAAGFILLPRIGMERSIHLLALAYGVVAILTIPREALRPWSLRKSVIVGAFALFAFAIVQFPFGLMANFYQRSIIERFQSGEKLLQVREGPLQTTAYTRWDYLGQPEYYRLVTDSYSMSSSGLTGRRYMSLYTYIPLALHPGASDALLISFGVGTTARSLTDTEEFDHIDFVDISRDVLDMSKLRFTPEENPLNDPRVEVHIEDGRYFLNTTDRRYDLITAEPPPPEVAGVVNLYTQEYFELVRSRLKEGGLVSYWLPLISYELEEAKSTVKGFCAAFPDCTLWDGAPYNWTLVGSRNAVPVTEDAIRRQWRSPRASPELQLTGIENAELLASLFIADADYLAEWTRDSLPLVDNWPSRAPRPEGPRQPMTYFGEMMQLPGTRERFEQSEFIRGIWPEAFIRKSLPYFDLQETANIQLYEFGRLQSMGRIHHILTRTDLATLPLWMLGTHHIWQRIAESLEGEAGAATDEVEYQLGLGALANREYARAAELLGDARGNFRARVPFRLYALCMAGDAEQARIEARFFSGSTPPNYWSFMEEECGVRNPLR